MFGLNGVPALSADEAALKRFVTRKPISLFSLRKNAKNKEEKEKLNQRLKLLRKKLPEGFKIGAAVGDGDSFFDSVAQGLNELRDKGFITGNGRFNVKSLRESCKQYAQQINQSKKDSWLDKALKGEGKKLRKYIRNIEFTTKDNENGSGSKIKIICGRPEIEGKIVCEKYGVKFRILELRDDEKDEFHVTKSKVGVGNNIVCIVNFRDHFVPLLSNVEEDTKRRLKVSRKEAYGNEIGLNSKNITQSCISALLQDIENSSHNQNGHSRSSRKENRKTGRKQRCSSTDPCNKKPKRAHIEVKTFNNQDTDFPCNVQDESRQNNSHRKRRCSIEDKDNDAPKRMHVDAKDTKNENLEFSNHLHYQFNHNELDDAYQTDRCIPHQLIRLMYQVDLSVLCSLRESLYKHKYPSLSLSFGDFEIDKFGNIILCYKEKSIHVKIESVDKYFTNNDISYARLFNKEKEKRSFFMNTYFDSFVKHLLFKSDKNIEYLIIYTNSGFDFTGEMILKQSRSKSFYPFKFDIMNIEDCGILKDFLFSNGNIKDHGFYQFSKNKASREELLKRLELSSVMQKEIKERKLSPEFEKETKEAFFDKLVFAVNQPNREELNSIVKDEISKVKGDYVELQDKILCDLTAQKVQKKHGNDVSEITYSFSLLMSFLHDMFLNNKMYSINLKGKGSDRSNGIAINYRNRTTYVKALHADSNIDYSQLFPSRTQERKNKFSINKHFSIFIEELERDKSIRYYIIYTNAGLDLTEENELKKGQSKDFHPLKLHSIDFQKKKYKVLRHCSCVNENGLYQFSQDEATILLSLLKLPPSFQSKKKETLTVENEKEIKEKFLNKLIFAVNQPLREETNTIIKNEIENKCNEVPHTYEELHEIALRWSESHEFGHITKERMEKLLADIKCNGSSYQKIQNISAEIKLAKSVVGREGTPTFNKFLHFLIKGEGIKYLVILKGNGINITNLSSILNRAGSSATKAFRDLYNLWFDAKGNKTLYLKTLKDERINLSNISSILRGAGANAAKAFKDLFDLWFDANRNKTQYLKTLEDKGISLTNMSSILNGAGNNAANVYRDIYDLWFDTKGNKTQYLKTLEDEGLNLPNMSSILSGAGAHAMKAFLDLYELWFDAKGNKTQYLKTLEGEGVNLPCMSSVLNGSGCNAAKAFKDLYNLWFDAKGNKTYYLKTLEDKGVNLANMSSILSVAGANATNAFKDLYDLWFDTKGNKTEFIKTLENEEVNLPNMSSILHGAGSKAGKAFKDLYDLWFDAKGNKSQYLKTLEDEGVNLSNMSGILRGSGANATKAFKELYNLWFNAEGNKTKYLKTLEDEGINLPNMSSLLNGAGANAAKAFKELYDLWFDAKGRRTQYLKTLEDEGVNLSSMSSILHVAGSKAAKAYKELYDLWFDAKGRKIQYLKTLEDEGINLPHMSSILNGAGANCAKAFKELYDLWFAKGNKTQYLKTLEDAGINLPNISSILSGAGVHAARAFKDLYELWFDAKGNKTQYLKTLEDAGINLPNISSILSGAGVHAARAFKDLYELWFDAKGNKTKYLKILEDKGLNLCTMSRVLNGSRSKAAKSFKDLFDLWFEAKGNETLFLKTLEDKGINLPIISGILNRAGSRASKAFKDLFNLWFDEKGNRTQYLKTLEDEKLNLLNISSILNKAGANAAKAFKDLYDLWFDAKGNKTLYLKTLEEEGVNVGNVSSILNKAGANAAKSFEELYNLWFDVEGNKTQYIKNLEDEGVDLKNVSNILHGAGSKAVKAFKELYYLWFDEKGNKTHNLKTMEDKGMNLPNISSILHGAGSKAGRAFNYLYDVWFDKEGNITQHLKHFINKKNRKKNFTLLNLSSIFKGSGANARNAFEKFHNVCFDNEGERTELLDDLYTIGFRPRHLSRLLCGAGAQAYLTLKKLRSFSLNYEEQQTQLDLEFFESGLSLDDLCNAFRATSQIS